MKIFYDDVSYTSLSIEFYKYQIVYNVTQIQSTYTVYNNMFNTRNLNII